MPRSQFRKVKSGPIIATLWHLWGWIERIPGETRPNDGLETGMMGATAARSAKIGILRAQAVADVDEELGEAFLMEEEITVTMLKARATTAPFRIPAIAHICSARHGASRNAPHTAAERYLGRPAIDLLLRSVCPAAALPTAPLPLYPWHTRCFLCVPAAYGVAAVYACSAAVPRVSLRGQQAFAPGTSASAVAPSR